MSTASRKIMKKRDKGASSATPPSKPSNNGGGSSSTSIRQFFGAAKSKKASAKGSQTDVDRVEIEKENDMSIRDLQDLHIDLDRGLYKTFLRKIVEKALYSRPTADLIDIVVGLVKGNELRPRLRGEGSQEMDEAVFDEKFDEGTLDQLVYEIRADAVECVQILMDCRPPIRSIDGKIVINRLHWCPGESSAGDASGIMNLLEWLKISSSEISMLVEDPNYDPRDGKVLPMSRLLCMAIRAMVDDLCIRLADFDGYGEAAVLRSSRLFKTLYDSSVTRHLRKSLVLSRLDVLFVTSSEYNPWSANASVQFDQVVGIVTNPKKPFNWRADILELLEAWYVLENSLPSEGETILKCKEEFFKGRLFDLVQSSSERRCYLNSACTAMRRDYLCGYVLKAFDSCFPRHLQQYQSRLEDKDLSAVLELAAEELEDKKAKRVSPLLSVVRDEEIVLDLVFHSLCTAIDTGLEYCTEKNVKAKALKAMQAICADDQDMQNYLAISHALLEGI